MNITLRYFGLAVIVLLHSCNNAEDNHISLQEVTTITVDEDVTRHFSNFFPITPTSPFDETLTLQNRESSPKLFVVDYEGNKLRKHGSYGSGPGELHRATLSGYDSSGNILVFDDMNMRFTRYYKSGDQASTYTFDYENTAFMISSYDPLHSCDDTWFLGINGESSESKNPVIAQLDNQMEIQELLGKTDAFFKNGEQDVQQTSVISVDCAAERIYTTHEKLPYIQVFNVHDQSKDKRITNKPSEFNLSNEITSFVQGMQAWQEYLITEQSSTHGLFHTEDYLIHVFWNATEAYFDTENFIDRNDYIAIYDRDNYSYIGQKEMEGAVTGITREGYLIEWIDDNPDNFELRLLNILVE